MPNHTAPAAPVRRRILIVEQHPLLRHGLASLVDSDPELSLCAAPTTPLPGLDPVDGIDADLVVINPMNLGGNCLEAVATIRKRHPDLPILVLASHDSRLFVERAFRAGASGYVALEEISETALVAIHQLLDGGRYVSPLIRARFDPDGFKQGN